MLTVNNLTLTLHHRPLLQEIAFSVSPGEVLTLMGPSGSGKSTLFAWMIGALEAPFHASGELWLNNERCDERPTERRRSGILFQDALLCAAGADSTEPAAGTGGTPRGLG